MPVRRRFGALGSSPLTRGKLLRRRRVADGVRLIPAHAGKTGTMPGSTRMVRAHPRSRGENDRPAEISQLPAGSSPLTRGKQSREANALELRGLIPAHAGKTPCTLGGTASVWAHPRSRGENVVAVISASGVAGSSPLTRGKQGSRRCGARCSRLIPAHAGKTIQGASAFRRFRAHPRSRGENKTTPTPA